MLEYTHALSAEEYCELRAAVQWQSIVKEQAQSGLEHSDYIVACHVERRIGLFFIASGPKTWTKALG